MKKSVPDWAIQVTWWLSGIFATGAIWHFLSVKDYQLTIAAAVCALVFMLIAIALHRKKDAQSQSQVSKNDAIVIRIAEEEITFTELVRSLPFDIVKVNAHTHSLGVMAEHAWISQRYPGCKFLRQELTTLDRLQQRSDKKTTSNHFDVMTIALSDNREKKIFFDISSFFSGRGTLLDPSSAIAEKLNTLYRLK